MKKLFSLFTAMSLLAGTMAHAQVPEGVDLSQMDLSKIDLSQYMQDPMSAPESDRYSIERLDCMAPDGKNIYGVAYIPKDGKQRHPLMILSHGFGASHAWLMAYGTGLAEQGIAVYTYDFCGGSQMSKSDGDVKDMSIIDQKEQLLAVFAQAQKWDFVDRKNLFIAGESQGGMVSAMAGPVIQKKLRGMILLYPALMIPVAMEALYPDLSDIDLSKHVLFKMTPVGIRYVIDAEKVNVTPLKTSFKKPVLILHGDRDEMVPQEYSIQAAKDYPAAEYHLMSGAGHGFNVQDGSLPVAIGHMAAFLKKHIK